MMTLVRIGGMALLMWCTVSIGMTMARALSKRVEELETALAVVTALENEISCTLSPPNEAIERMEKRELFAAAVYLPACASMCRQGIPFPRAWKRAVGEQHGALSDDDIDLLQSLADTLGQYNLEQQLAQTAAVRAQLQLQLDGARERCNHYSKLYRTMGVLSGAFLIILFV
ncbi:MAG: hypothetical protein HFG20_04135 [Anaerotruncus sp.]|nr:hypothetical protein [Anaerotruncus sp.]